MAKTKVSEWDVVADNNQDISGITLGTGMPPSYVNDSIREMMSQIKDWQSGSSGDDYTITGNLGVNGTLTINGSSGTSGQVLVSQGSGEVPKWGDAFVSGMIMLWSGATNEVPSGWALCNGSNGTPDLRDRFVVGAGTTHAVNATGGSANSVVVSHNHSASTNTVGNHTHGSVTKNSLKGPGDGVKWFKAQYYGESVMNSGSTGGGGSHAHSVTVNSKGESGTNKNLPPYYALAYIMKV